jgi:hypothetical protein
MSRDRDDLREATLDVGQYLKELGGWLEVHPEDERAEEVREVFQRYADALLDLESGTIDYDEFAARVNPDFRTLVSIGLGIDT